MEVFWLCVAASAAALVGGIVAIRGRKRLELAMALTSGLVLGLVFFDLLPEIFDITRSQNISSVWPMVALVVGFLAFHLVENYVLIHESAEEHYSPHVHPKLGVARAVALTGHSFLDGFSIGIGFQVSSAVGVAVAIAVIGHRFADGFDTTNYMLFHKNSMQTIKKLLSLVVIMPIVGGLASLGFDMSEATLSIYLGFFAGFLLYIGASNISPQAHSKGPSYKNILATIVGVLFIFLVTRLA